MRRLRASDTGRVMVGLIGLALIYEVMTLAHGDQATISEWVWTMSTNPLFLFAAAFQLGHWFYPKGSCAHCGSKPTAATAESMAFFDEKLRVWARERAKGAGVVKARRLAGMRTREGEEQK